MNAAQVQAMLAGLQDGGCSLFMSEESRCSYFPERRERQIFTIVDPDDSLLREQLNDMGFRRAQLAMYRPHCVSCRACVPVRVRVDAFVWARHWRRVLRRNEPISICAVPLGAVCPTAMAAMEALFHRYVRQRHRNSHAGSMPLAEILRHCPAHSCILQAWDSGVLRGAMIVDRYSDSLSAVYSFYEPNLPAQSLGSYLILMLIRAAQAEGLDYVHLGYSVRGLSKMAYKTRFRPLEQLGASGWEPLDERG